MEISSEGDCSDASLDSPVGGCCEAFAPAAGEASPGGGGGDKFSARGASLVAAGGGGGGGGGVLSSAAAVEGAAADALSDEGEDDCFLPWFLLFDPVIRNFGSE